MTRYPRKIITDSPLACPYCDESAFRTPHAFARYTESAIYVHRTCIMGHTFYSVESVPENQEEIENVIKSLGPRKYRYPKKDGEAVKE